MPSKSPLIKVFFLFLLGIILPTSFLVYLGVMSIHSETLLLRKESQERLGKTLEGMQNQADAVISRILSRYEETGRDLWKNPKTKIASEPSEFLVLVSAQNQLIYPIDERTFPKSQLSFLPSSLEERFHETESLEFKVKDYGQALAGYQSLEKMIQDSRWKAALELSQAGCLAKLNRKEEANDLYEDIATRFGNEHDPQGRSYALLAQLQRAELQGKHADLLQGLLSQEWHLGWDDEQFFVQRVLNGRRKEDSRFDHLAQEWERRQEIARRAKQFVQQTWPTLEKTYRAADSRRPAFVFSPLNQKIIYAIAPLFDPGTDIRQGTFVAELPSERLSEPLEETLRSFADAGACQYRLDRDRQGPAWPLEARLSQVVPPLNLKIAPSENLPVQQLAAKRRRIYMAMVALAVFVIGIALYATWFAVSREMEVAQLKSRFVASMSHELKTPLSIIGLIGQKLKLGRYSSDAEAKEYYSMLSEETDRLRGLIDEVLDFSRLMENRKPYHFEPVDLRDVIREAVERFRQSVSGRTFELSLKDLPSPIVLPIDREAFSRVILNLLDNAVKYSPMERTKINVSLDGRVAGRCCARRG